MTKEAAKKRIIFQLVYDSGQFCLSRNFRLQRVGDLSWLLNSYDFPKLARNIDELIIVDATRGLRDTQKFTETVRNLSRELFAPLTLGGGINSLKIAEEYLSSGADKVILNTAFIEDQGLVFEMAENFGAQFIIMSMDVLRNEAGYRSMVSNGSREGSELSRGNLSEISGQAGEIVLRSIERDGSGNGLDLGMLSILPNDVPVPILVSGGVGNATHILTGLEDKRVSGVVTANLLNFVGDGMSQARKFIIDEGVQLANFS
jgi:cyclase